MSTKTINMTDQLYAYMLNHALREHPILKELRDVTQTMPKSNMQISPEQGQFMALLIKLLAARKTLDVGVFTGYSSLVVALALPKDGRIVACDVDPETTAVAQQFWQKAHVANKIDLRLAPAEDTLQELIDAGQSNNYDFAFIDADKKSYPNYYDKCLQLIRPGGLIAIDNMFRDGDVADFNINDESTSATRALQQIIHTDTRVDASLVPIGDGLMLARKRFS